LSPPPCPDLRTCLHFAAAKGKEEIVDLLVQRGADVHMRDRWGRNALQDAIDNNFSSITSRLAAQVGRKGLSRAECGAGIRAGA
jgi:ankyrin repeat protein